MPPSRRDGLFCNVAHGFTAKRFGDELHGAARFREARLVRTSALRKRVSVFFTTRAVEVLHDFLDGAPMHTHAMHFENTLGKLTAAELGLELLFPNEEGDDLGRALHRSLSPTLFFQESGHTLFAKGLLDLVEALAGVTEKLGRTVDGHGFHLVASEHLVLHLKLVVGIEKRDALEQRREDFVRMGMEQAGALESHALVVLPSFTSCPPLRPA